MTAPITPGQIAHETYWLTFAGRPPTLPWEQLIPDNRAAWEAAAQAVLAGTVAAPLRHAGDAAAAGTCCPACGGTALAWGLWGAKTPVTCSQEVECRQCQALWTAVYALTGYEGLTRPEEDQGA